jgi:hypothetical protein
MSISWLHCSSFLPSCLPSFLPFLIYLVDWDLNLLPVLAMEVLYHFSHKPRPFCFSYFSARVLHFCPGPASSHDFPNLCLDGLNYRCVASHLASLSFNIKSLWFRGAVKALFSLFPKVFGSYEMCTKQGNLFNSRYRRKRMRTLN